MGSLLLIVSFTGGFTANALAPAPTHPSALAPPARSATLDEATLSQAAPEKTTTSPIVATGNQGATKANSTTAATAPVSAALTRPSPAFEISGAPGKGLTLRSADNAYALTVRARMQARETATLGDKPSNEINIRTVRLFVQGHVFAPELRYTVQLAFGPGEFDTTSPSLSPSPIFDAFIEYSKFRDLNLKIGQYFAPFDRARTIREFALQLVDRQQAVSEFNLDRDVGVSVYSNDLFGWGGRLNYTLGIFGGDGRNRVGALKPGFLYLARLGVRPFGSFDDDVEGDLERQARPRLALGVAAAYNDNTDRQRSTIGKILTTGTFDYFHAASDLVFKWQGLSVLAEALYRQANHNRRNKIIDGTAVTEYSRSGWGYLTQAGFMLTRKLEAAARWDQTFAQGKTDPTLIDLAKKQGNELGGGFNLYLNGHFFKVQVDYSVRFNRLNGAAPHTIRLQLDATF